ncbi:hypothetical protein [Microbacterium sp. KR10-403]|uniref:hypothetical protein n=1 Tax=Microbacterium sp. KR10-403 TaxID=3158581 RepID=UPI0032E522D6
MITDAWFHIDPNNGDPRLCRDPETCGWAETKDHRRTAVEASRLYEEMMTTFKWVRFHKRGPGRRITKEVLKPFQ